MCFWRCRSPLRAASASQVGGPNTGGPFAGRGRRGKEKRTEDEEKRKEEGRGIEKKRGRSDEKEIGEMECFWEKKKKGMGSCIAELVSSPCPDFRAGGPGSLCLDASDFLLWILLQLGLCSGQAGFWRCLQLWLI